MSYFDDLRDFLGAKLQENNLSRQDLANGTNISLPTLSRMLHKGRLPINHKVIDSRPASLSLQSVLNIANYLNCSMDEALGRKDYAAPKETNFEKVAIDHVMGSLKEFITRKLEEANLDIYELSKHCGFSRTAFAKFTAPSNPKATISTPAAIALADYFKVSLDDITGRTAAAKKERTVEVISSTSASITPKFLRNLDKKDFEVVEAIRKTNLKQSPAHARGTQTQPAPQPAKPSRVK